MTDETDAIVDDEAEDPAWLDPFPTETSACSCVANDGPHPRLGELVQLAPGSGVVCRWRSARLHPDEQAGLDAAACVVADGIMRWRCRGAPASYLLWRNAVNGGTALSGGDRSRVVPFVSPLFGLDGAPKPEEHLRGWIAEYVWFRLVSETPGPPERSLRRVEGPSFHATEPGGDGLAVWRQNGEDGLRFCLWEIKNYSGTGSISPTVRGAYEQLGIRALEYLAKLTSIEAASDDAEVAPLYAALVDLWVDKDPRCGVGVAVSTHHERVPSRCFSTMGKHFPGFASDWQREGLVTGLGEFAEFCRDVRSRVWKAL